MQKEIAKIALVLVALAVSTVATTGSASSEPIDCASQTATLSQVSATAKCNVEGWAVETTLGNSLTVPERGTSVSAVGLRDDGVESPMVSLYHGTDGGIAVLENSQIVASSSKSASTEALKHLSIATPGLGEVGLLAVSKCDSAAPYSHMWAGYASKNYYWYYNSSGQPSTTSLARMQNAAATIADGSSSTCGGLSNGLTQTYGGAASSSPNITSTGSCTTNDLASVVGFGAVDGTYLAWACRWTSGTGHLSHADIRFDNSSRSWHTSSSTSGCTGSTWDLQGVATHEFGHAVGLNHVDPSEPQVMNPSLSQCNFTWRQLGRGDQNGLRALYGP